MRENVHQELGMYVDSPEFIGMFEFVVNMGANRNTLIKQLREFGSAFVDQKQRALRLQAFAVANTLPLEAPRCKLAMLMRACRKSPARTWCPTPEPAWTQASRRGGKNARETETRINSLRNCFCL